MTHTVALQVDSVTPEIKDPSGLWRRGATAKALIDRKDFGLTWNVALETGGFMVGDEIKLRIDAEADEVVEETAEVAAAAVSA